MISFCITVANEEFEFRRLLSQLVPYVLDSEEIVVLADKNKLSPEVERVAASYSLQIHEFDFRENFSEFKNQLFNLASKDYIFQIDADEQIPPSLISALRELAIKGETDTVFVPRINYIVGATDEDAQEFGWQINEIGWEGFPDYQGRFCLRSSDIRWEGNVHEMLAGYKHPVRLEAHNVPQAMNLSILHVKTIHKQRVQNKFYESIQR